jgi:hypothetical protein
MKNRSTILSALLLLSIACSQSERSPMERIVTNLEDESGGADAGAEGGAEGDCCDDETLCSVDEICQAFWDGVAFVCSCFQTPQPPPPTEHCGGTPFGECGDTRPMPLMPGAEPVCSAGRVCTVGEDGTCGCQQRGPLLCMNPVVLPLLASEAASFAPPTRADVSNPIEKPCPPGQICTDSGCVPNLCGERQGGTCGGSCSQGYVCEKNDGPNVNPFVAPPCHCRFVGMGGIN